MNDPKLGIGGAPTRATTLPEDAAGRKTYPIASGLLDYFPDALAAIAHLSYVGNEQHNKGKPLHWDRSKSADEADTLLRHFLQRGTVDKDSIRHSVKMAWRALALLQKEIEAEQPSGTPSDKSIEGVPEAKLFCVECGSTERAWHHSRCSHYRPTAGIAGFPLPPEVGPSTAPTGCCK